MITAVLGDLHGHRRGTGPAGRRCCFMAVTLDPLAATDSKPACRFFLPFPFSPVFFFFFLFSYFSWAPSPYCSPPGCPFPVKSLALSALVSPRIIHFRVLDKSPVSGPGRGPPSCNNSSVLAWRIPGTGEPSGLPSMESHRVRHD